MTLRSETPPSPGNQTVATPPPSDRPTTAQLKADIDSGRTGDKIPAYDPGLSQLGTDDEAAGRPPEAARIATARETEGDSRRDRAAGHATGHGRNRFVLAGYIGLIVMAAIVVGLALWLLR